MVGRKSPGGSVSIAQPGRLIQRKMAEILRFWPSFAPFTRQQRTTMGLAGACDSFAPICRVNLFVAI